MPSDSAQAGSSGRADRRQLRWNRHNQVRRQHIIDAAVEVLGETEPMARARGVELDPETPVERLLEAALEGAE